MFSAGKSVTRNLEYLKEAFPHVNEWKHVWSTKIVGKVTSVEGKFAFVQWLGEEWAKAGPVKYFSWQLDPH